MATRARGRRHQSRRWRVRRRGARDRQRRPRVRSLGRAGAWQHEPSSRAHRHRPRRDGVSRRRDRSEHRERRARDRGRRRHRGAARVARTTARRGPDAGSQPAQLRRVHPGAGGRRSDPFDDGAGHGAYAGSPGYRARRGTGVGTDVTDRWSRSRRARARYRRESGKRRAGGTASARRHSHGTGGARHAGPNHAYRSAPERARGRRACGGPAGRDDPGARRRAARRVRRAGDRVSHQSHGARFTRARRRHLPDLQHHVVRDPAAAGDAWSAAGDRRHSARTARQCARRSARAGRRCDGAGPAARPRPG